MKGRRSQRWKMEKASQNSWHWWRWIAAVVGSCIGESNIKAPVALAREVEGNDGALGCRGAAVVKAPEVAEVGDCSCA